MTTMYKAFCVAVLAMALVTRSAAGDDIKVGFITSLSGNASSIGIPYGRGIDASLAYQGEVNHEKIQLIKLDDGSDPSATARNARKLIEEDNVDVLIGTATAPSTLAVAAVAAGSKVPLIGVSPVTLQFSGTGEQWVVAIPQPPSLFVKVIVERMKREGMKSFAYIGFSDASGDLFFKGAKQAELETGLKILIDERYARSDSSVTGQILKILGTQADAVLIGSSGTQGALPLLALAERGFKGKVYGTGALINPDFIRLGGKAAEGIQVSTGPVIVADQLPDGHFAKKLSLEFREIYQKVNGVPTTDAFSAYSFDAWRIFCNAAERALNNAKPGTSEFRSALNREILNTKELPGVHAIYNFAAGKTYGVDDRALVVARLVNGAWKYTP
jgi:branched-chain amino acid transport system substrate-binding protein